MSRERPNLLFIMCDELRATGLGCYGDPVVRTPHLDALAASGCRVEQAISNNPVCMPARSIVLSGQYSRTCCGTLINAGWPGWPGGEGGSFKAAGFPQWPTARRRHLPDPTLPELLRDAGYATAAVGKWHVEAWPDAIGFDHYRIPAHHHANSAQWYITDGGPPETPPGYGPDHEADHVIDLLEGYASGEAPFFLYYNLSPPHMPLMDAPAKYLQMFGRGDVRLRPNVPGGFQPDADTMGSYLWDYRAYRDGLPHAIVPEDADLVTLHALYYGLTAWVDDVVGRVMAGLRAAGLDENTVVMFTSDHGENLGSHGRMGKCSLNDESARVPMLAVGPGIPTGSTTRRVIGLVDVAATLLGFAGLDAPAHLHGRDRVASLTGRDDPVAIVPDDPATWTDAALDAPDANLGFVETKSHGIAVRTPTHTLGLPWSAGDGDVPPHAVGDRPHWFSDRLADPFESDHTPGGTIGPFAEALQRRLERWHHALPFRDLP